MPQRGLDGRPIVVHGGRPAQGPAVDATVQGLVHPQKVGLLKTTFPPTTVSRFLMLAMSRSGIEK